MPAGAPPPLWGCAAPRCTHLWGVPTPLDEESSDGALDEVLKVLGRLPFVSSVKRDVEGLRELLYFRRAPRIVCVGLPGSGRTSLVNALLGRDVLPDVTEEGGWIRTDAAGTLLDWLEIHLGDDGSMRDAMARALEESAADCVLVACAPEDLDGRLAGVLAELRGHLGAIDRPKATFAVLTKIDALPPEDADPPYPDDKRNTIDLTLHGLRQLFGEADLKMEAAFAVSALQRNGLDHLSDAILRALPDRAKMEAARALVHAGRGRREVANRIVQSVSTLALTVGLAPVPFSDAFVIAPLQVTMVSSIAHLAGRDWDKRAVTEWIASMGVVGTAGMGLRWTARQLLKIVPGAGTVVSAGIAGAGTVTMGQSAIAYFLREEAKRLPEDAASPA